MRRDRRRGELDALIEGRAGTETPLGELVAALRAPHQPGELDGLDAALAAFRQAGPGAPAVAPPPAARRGRLRSAALKVLAVVGGASVVGGVAYAAQLATHDRPAPRPPAPVVSGHSARPSSPPAPASTGASGPARVGPVRSGVGATTPPSSPEPSRSGLSRSGGRGPHPQPPGQQKSKNPPPGQQKSKKLPPGQQKTKTPPPGQQKTKTPPPGQQKGKKGGSGG